MSIFEPNKLCRIRTANHSKPSTTLILDRYIDTIQELLKKIISVSGIPERAILHLSEYPPKTN